MVLAEQLLRFPSIGRVLFKGLDLPWHPFDHGLSMD